MKELSLKDVSLARPYRVYSLERGLHLLEVLAEGAPEKSLTEVSQKSGFNLSTTHRILTTLKYRGYVRQNGSTSKYRLTFKLFEL
ncbi:helix-turn-helix domain-containing protein [Candidatus Aerophobetes bacterium]|nr:helix-turn-helix domain-containing protein [Candidatus Aerophobetes bacterium]